MPSAVRALYASLPEDVRRCLRPLGLLDTIGARLPAPGGDRLTHAVDATRRLRRLATLRYPVRRLVGPVRGAARTLACVVAADEPSTRWWRHVLFAAPPTEEVLGSVRALAVPRAARRPVDDADLALWQASWPVAPHDGARVPSWTPLELAIDRPFEEIVRGSPHDRAGRKGDARRVARLGLTARLLRGPEAVERFRRELYEPWVARRFGPLAVPLPWIAFRQAAARGWVQWLEADGAPAGGTLLVPDGADGLRILAFAARLDGAAAPLAIQAAYVHAIHAARALGRTRLALGTCRPSLTDGVLRYKRKWGGRLVPPNTRDAFLLRYRHTTAVRAALAATPLVLDRGDGRLAAVAGTDGAPPADVAAALHVPGLDTLAVLAPAAGPPGAVRGTAVVPVGPLAVWPPEAALP